MPEYMSILVQEKWFAIADEFCKTRNSSNYIDALEKCLIQDEVPGPISHRLRAYLAQTPELTPT